jgi:dipeptidyl aminopeptidase/acylaminoacyl peptidase
MALRTDDFHAVTPDSAVHDRAEMEQSTHALLDGIDRWIALSFDIDSLEVSGDLARAVVRQHADRMARRSDGLVHHVETWVTQREIWRRTSAGWKLYRVDNIRDQRRLIDGATAAAGQDRLSGTWEGYWSRAGDTMAVTMIVRRDSATQRYAATFAADRLRVSGIPFADVQVQGCCDVTLVLRGDRTTTQFVGVLRSDSLTGVLREGASDGRFAYARALAARPAFQEQDITFPNGAVTLAGSLLLPATGGGDSLPAVVFLHGSGPEGRWASRYLATQLATHGIAALIFDKRGVGGSTGDWRRATPDDLVGDGVAAVARLLDEPRIGRGRVGIHGHSQGGTLAPWVAARAPAVAFVIASAAAGLPLDSVEIFSILNSVYPAAATAADSARAREYVSELVAAAYHARARGRLDSLVTQLRDRPWFFEPPAPADAYWWFSKSFGQYHPLDWWAQVRVPVLLMYGAEDRRVPAAESAERIGRALRGAGNRDVAVRILPGADHTFRLAPGASGWPVTAPGYIPSLLEWLAKR